MPEGYTHIRTARAAARLAGITPADGAAFDCGANGPDMLFCYRVWRKSARRGEDLPKIGEDVYKRQQLKEAIYESETQHPAALRMLGVECGRL